MGGLCAAATVSHVVQPWQQEPCGGVVWARSAELGQCCSSPGLYSGWVLCGATSLAVS